VGFNSAVKGLTEAKTDAPDSRTSVVTLRRQRTAAYCDIGMEYAPNGGALEFSGSLKLTRTVVVPFNDRRDLQELVARM
jgi:hypothetical protein